MYKTDDKILEEIKKIPIVDYAKYLGLTVERVGNHYYTTKGHDSIRIDIVKNRYTQYSNSDSKLQGDVIAFVQNFGNCSYPEAIETLKKYAGISDNNYYNNNYNPKYTTKPTYQPITEEPKMLLMPGRAENNKRVIAYLTKSRFLNSSIVKELIGRGLIFQEKDKNNVIFVGLDENGIPKYACRRSSLSNVQFRGECSGSDKKYGFNFSGKDKEKLYIFEAPIDAISHATIANIVYKSNSAWKEHSRIALGGTSDVALEQYLKTHSEVKELHLCLDNDDAGRSASQKITEKYAKQGYKVLIHTPKNKDFNEDLEKYYIPFAKTLNFPSKNKMVR